MDNIILNIDNFLATIFDHHKFFDKEASVGTTKSTTYSLRRTWNTRAYNHNEGIKMTQNVKLVIDDWAWTAFIPLSDLLT